VTATAFCVLTTEPLTVLLLVVVFAVVFSVGFEVSDTVCVLFFVVVVATLVSFSSFADVLAEVVNVVVWLTAEVSTLSAGSETLPHEVKITVLNTKIAIAFFIKNHAPLSSNISQKFSKIHRIGASSTFVTIRTARFCRCFTVSQSEIDGIAVKVKLVSELCSDFT
jgi:hypothetical protein